MAILERPIAEPIRASSPGFVRYGCVHEYRRPRAEATPLEGARYDLVCSRCEYAADDLSRRLSWAAAWHHYESHLTADMLAALAAGASL